MKKYIAFILIFVSTSSFADVALDIEKAVLNNLKQTQEENIDGVMDTMHSKSPLYSSTKQFLIKIFPAYDIKYEILKYHFVGLDGEYAYARVLQYSEKISGPMFKNNKLESLQIFKKDGGQWKLWSQANLGITYR